MLTPPRPTRGRESGTRAIYDQAHKAWDASEARKRFPDAYIFTQGDGGDKDQNYWLSDKTLYGK